MLVPYSPSSGTPGQCAEAGPAALPGQHSDGQIGAHFADWTDHGIWSYSAGSFASSANQPFVDGYSGQTGGLPVFNGVNDVADQGLDDVLGRRRFDAMAVARDDLRFRRTTGKRFARRKICNASVTSARHALATRPFFR